MVRDPIRRAEALFTLAGITVGELNEPKPSPALLMEAMEQRETLADAKAKGDLAAIDHLAGEVDARRRAVEEKLARGSPRERAAGEARWARAASRRAPLSSPLPRRGERDRGRDGRGRRRVASLNRPDSKDSKHHGPPRDLRPQSAPASHRHRSGHDELARRVREERAPGRDRRLQPDGAPPQRRLVRRERRRRRRRGQTSRVREPARHDREREALHGSRRGRRRDAAHGALRVHGAEGRRGERGALPRRRGDEVGARGHARRSERGDPARAGAPRGGRAPERRWRGHHGARVLRRRAEAGDEGRRAARGDRRPPPAERADGGRARLRAREEAERDLRRLRPRRRHVRRDDPRARGRRLPGEVDRRRQRPRRRRHGPRGRRRGVHAARPGGAVSFAHSHRARRRARHEARAHRARTRRRRSIPVRAAARSASRSRARRSKRASRRSSIAPASPVVGP